MLVATATITKHCKNLTGCKLDSVEIKRAKREGIDERHATNVEASRMSAILSVPVDPMNSGFWFQVRTLVNFILSAAFCALSVFTLSAFMPVWAADALGISATLYVFAVLLNKRPIKIRCEHCQKYVLSNTPWICGFCSAKNENADDFPFVYKCQHCSAAPKAYKCHHRDCGELIYLSEDRLEANFACCVNSQVAVVPESKKIVRIEEREEMEHAISMAELDSKLSAIKKQREQGQPKPPLDQKKESLERHYALVMAARELAKKKKAEVAETFKDDPEGLKDAIEAIDDWVERNIG